MLSRLTGRAGLEHNRCVRFDLRMTTTVREERKVLTAVFADVVGSTALAERLDPEDVKLVVGEAVARIVGEVESLGGHVKDLAGDGVLAFFGAPTTREDELRCGAVVNAAGAWARRIGALAGLEVPVDGYRRQVAVLEAERTKLPIVTEELACGEVLYLRGEGERHVLAGLHSETTSEQPADPDDYAETPDPAFEARIAELVSKRLVEGRSLRLRGGWAGLYPVAAGGRPIVAETEVAGFFVLAGLGGNGIQLAPALGEDLAGLVAGRA